MISYNTLDFIPHLFGCQLETVLAVVESFDPAASLTQIAPAASPGTPASAARPLLPHLRHRNRSLRSSTFTAGGSPSPLRASGVSSAMIAATALVTNMGLAAEPTQFP